MARIEAGKFPELNDSVVVKLHSNNIFTVYDFMAVALDDLIKRSGLSFKAIENVREQIFKEFGGHQVSPVEHYAKETGEIVSTGVKDLDKLLEGGLRCGQIYEICGSSSSGKSQLCHWISVHATLNAACEVHYVDATSNFSVSRIQMILETQQCNDRIIAKVMSNIKVYKILKISDLFTILHNLVKKDDAATMRRIVIIDSLVVPFLMAPFNELNSLLANFASVSRYFVNHCRGVVVTVNTVRLEDGGRTLFEADKKVTVNTKPSLTNYWMSVPNVRLLMSSLENNRRKIAVWKSHQLENGRHCTILIKDEGILSV